MILSTIYKTFDQSQKTGAALIFRNYIAVSTDKDFKNQIFIDNEFWISSINTQVEVNPKEPCDLVKLPSDFYIVNKKSVADKKATNQTAAIVLGSCAALVVLSLVTVVVGVVIF